MNQVDNITDQAKQQTLVELADGSILTLTLMYNGATQRWTMNAVHTLLTINGMSVVMHPNMLRQWRRVINFGLACTTLNGQDPVNVDDFSEGRASLFSLDEEDVLGVEQNVMGAPAL